MKKTKIKRKKTVAVTSVIAEIEKISEPVHWMQLLGSVLLGLIGVKFIWGFRPNWIVGGSAELASAFFMIRSFPSQFEVQTSTEVKKKDMLNGAANSSWNVVIWLGIV